MSLCTNGSSPLHAASYYGHESVVEVLVLAGADRSLRNMYELTPADEAKTRHIRDFITNPRRPISAKRFSDLPSFEVCTIDSCKTLWTFENRFHSFSRAEVVASVEGASPQLAARLSVAINSDDTAWNAAIIHVYTMEAPLYKRMNLDIASANKLTTLIPYAKHLDQALNTLPQHDTGPCFRGAALTDDQIASYREIDRWFYWPAFTSCSKSRESCLGGNVLFVIHPSDYYGMQAPYEISQFSFFPDEEEVLFSWGRQLKVRSIDESGAQDGAVVIELDATNIGT